MFTVACHVKMLKISAPPGRMTQCSLSLRSQNNKHLRINVSRSKTLLLGQERQSVQAHMCHVSFLMLLVCKYNHKYHIEVTFPTISSILASRWSHSAVPPLDRGRSSWNGTLVCHLCRYVIIPILLYSTCPSFLLPLSFMSHIVSLGDFEE